MSKDPKADGKGLRKLKETKTNNKMEATQRRLAGNDSAKTRDAGTNRRNWRNK